MSDGLSEGARWAEERDERQKKIDAFFAAIEQFFHKKMLLTNVMALFDAFDALRYEGHLIKQHLQKGRPRRKSAMQKSLEQAVVGHDTKRTWCRILAIALQHASPSVTDRLRDCAKMTAIALLVPNRGGAAPSIYGDIFAVLDGIKHATGELVMLDIADAPRAVISVSIPDGEITSDPKLVNLCFLAICRPEKRESV
jgi:hypothetical protein